MRTRLRVLFFTAMKKSTIKFIIEGFNKDQSINPKWISQVTDGLFKEFNAQKKKTEFDFFIEEKIKESNLIRLRFCRHPKLSAVEVYNKTISYLNDNEIVYRIVNAFDPLDEKNAIIEVL